MDHVKLMECLVVCGSCQVDGVSCCVDHVKLMTYSVMCGCCEVNYMFL